MPDPTHSLLTAEQFEALSRLDACTLADAIETFQRRLRNEGFVDQTVRGFFRRLPPMLGYAATVKIRGSAPPIGNVKYPERTEWWDYVVSLPAPRVLVIQDASTNLGTGSLVGAVYMNILRALHCVGVVTNGSVRDLPAAEAAGFHFFAHSVALSHAYVHIVETGRPVEIGGLTIRSGDLLHGDAHGVQTIPLDIAARIPPVAAKLAACERALIELCQSPGVTLEKIRAAFSEGLS
ncbi:MAG TPA: RraA family protein [Dongiaceae bacterium]|nr:RraA family protein [Dongiaceae bacterium]